MLEHFFTTVPGIIIAVAGLIGGAVVGGLYIVSVIKGKKDNSDDRLINILQDTVTALETKVDNQKKEHDSTVTELTDKIDKLTDKVDHLEKENETLTKVLQGRDDKTQEFYAKAFEAIEIGNKTFALVKSLADSNTELLKILAQKKPDTTIINNRP